MDNTSLALKIYTDNGLTQDNLFLDKKAIHLGCGDSKLKGAVGVDMLDLKSVDIVHDPDNYPWPFEPNSIDVVVAHSVLEHVVNIVDFFNEVWRISKNGSRLVIEVPYFRSVDSFTDPTHKHFFTSESLNYFIEGGGSLSGYNYTNCKFKKIGFWYGWPQPSQRFFVRLFKSFIKKHPHFYDQYVSLFLPVKVLFWELEVIK